MEGNLKKFIDLFEHIASNPVEAIKNHKKETGKGAVGVLPVYAPEELIDAAGYLPVGIWGGHHEISKARTYLPAFACSIMQSIMEMELEGAFDNLSAVLMSVPCDTLKCFSQKWHGKCKPIIFTHPQNRKIKAANLFLEEEYKIVRRKLEEILDVKITDEAINKSIEVYNENRKVMREFTEIAAKYPQIIDPIVRHNVIKSRWFITKKQHTEYVKDFIKEIKKLKVEPWKGKKVILTGIMAEPKEVLEIMKSENFAVVADDLAQESRQFRIDVPEGGTPLQRLAKWWQDFDGCALATDPKKVRGQMLIDMCKKYEADAVIVCMMKFCDPEEFDYPIYYKELNNENIRNIMIEIDLEMTSFEQIKTRLQSFNETL
ncbi:MAG: 2-hydroxyacyl-CoA dehydratase family protein [Fusobacterium sp. JB021]|nr:2-hydroxyacyl-CoA dehydratase family protein [Fusobacterium sp. JB020]MDP0492994.1 2-hydroxyacyl-CoA dehydratase family protein [Fusobacterium sp. JB021]MDP0507147.1 2-hydroxyacyl-CoA dehydratase family protein [Fusobacterium sp. JB019]